MYGTYILFRYVPRQILGEHLVNNLSDCPKQMICGW